MIINVLGNLIDTTQIISISKPCYKSSDYVRFEFTINTINKGEIVYNICFRDTQKYNLEKFKEIKDWTTEDAYKSDNFFKLLEENKEAKKNLVLEYCNHLISQITEYWNKDKSIIPYIG